ncbi:MAG: hypothetical protein ABI895_37100 [Deltaproteobacteria bacterium]
MQPISENDLRAIERHFHAVIRERAAQQVEEHKLVLPDLAAFVLAAEPEAWFPVPGMYGGFRYYFDGDAEEPTLVTESWCRVVDGSGQRHTITTAGSALVCSGF